MKPVAPLIGAVVLTASVPASRSQLDPPTGVVEVSPPVVREPSDTFDIPIREAGLGSLSVYLPGNCILDDDFDLVLHFHGAPDVFEDALRESGLNAAIAVENLGVMSAAYRGRYSHQGTYELLMRRVVALVDEACPGQEHEPRRIALSAWSAGYAAVQDILASPQRATNVDAVLLADGPHTAFVEKRFRNLPDNALDPFVSFGAQAVEGSKLMVITHSDVVTNDYASTTESNDFILARLGLDRRFAERPGPLDGMHQVTEARAGKLLVSGYDGRDERAHADHLLAFRHTLLTPLMEYWDSTPAPVTEPHDARPVNVKVEVKHHRLCTVVGSYEECRDVD